MHLTWSGFDAAVDVIAACCSKVHRAGVYGRTPAGQMLALAIAERLGMEVLRDPAPGMLVVEGFVDNEALLAAFEGMADVEIWAWVDATPEHCCNSVMKVDGTTLVQFPWQDTPSCERRSFVPGFDD